MIKKVTDIQKQEILESFLKGKTIKELSLIYNFSSQTISRQLKNNLGKEKFEKIKSSIGRKTSSSREKNIKNFKTKSNTEIKQKFINESKAYFEDNLNETEFFELVPLSENINLNEQKDLSSTHISEVDFPRIVYMIVDKKIELEIKFLRDYPEWQFLSQEDLNRKTIQIFYDLKNAKRSCTKDQKVIKIPNTTVFKIVAPLLISRGISRIVCEENLIAL